MEKYIHQNENQKQFIQSTDRYIKLLAPAGSGKTRCLLEYVLYQIENDKEQKFMFFSFTRTAADEIESRINNEDRYIKIRDKVISLTLNSYGNAFVKKDYFKTYSKLIEENEKKWILTNNCGNLLNLKKFDYVADLIQKKGSVAISKQKKIMQLIEDTKLLGFTDEYGDDKEKIVAHLNFLRQVGCQEFLYDYLIRVEDMFRVAKESSKTEEFLEIEEFKNVTIAALMRLIRFCNAVNHQLRQNSRYTFTDQIYLAYRYLSETLLKYKDKEKITIIVDEFQDSSPLDVFLINEMKKYYNAKVILAGDDDQSIYQFRGAALGIILNPQVILEDDFSTYILETNYRSPKNIIEFSQNLIKNNNEREEKKVSSHLSDVADVDTFSVKENLDELIEKIKERSNNNESVALIARKKSHLVPLQVLLNHHEISFFSEEDLNIFVGDAFNSIIQLLFIKEHYKQTNNFKYISIDDYMTIFDTVFKYKANKNIKAKIAQHIWKFSRDIENLDDLEKMIIDMPEIKEIKWGSNTKHHQVSLARIVREFFETTTVEEMINLLQSSFASFEQDFGRDELFHRDPPLEQLSLLARSYKSDFGKMRRDLTRIRDNSNDPSYAVDEKIHLTTAFRTKGREYDHTFLLSCDNITWPSSYAKTNEQLETERRIFYVAMTRAKKSMTFVITEPENISRYLYEMGFLEIVVEE